MEFNTLIIKWYKAHKRSLPWRENKNPYSIWLSEVILQQTQVVQGMPYYHNFIEKYPTVHDLAAAEEDEVLKLWQGLGYYSRARNLHAAAKYVSNDCQGNFPDSYKKLLKMKGVGDYTASAIASIAYDEPVSTVDGNVLRVISRVFDVETPVDTDKGKKEIKTLMDSVLDKDNPGDFNQAVMELGALICKPKSPDCTACPVVEKCLALSHNTIVERPVKTKKLRIKDEYIDYLLIKDDQGIIMQQRDDSSIWKNLFDLPNTVSEKPLKDQAHLELLLKEYTDKSALIALKKGMIHKLTHKRLHIRFFMAEFEGSVLKSYCALDDVKDKAVPKPIEDFLKDFVL